MWGRIDDGAGPSDDRMRWLCTQVQKPMSAAAAASRTGAVHDRPGSPRSPGALRLCGVRHAFGDRCALDGVSIDVASGVLTGLLGPNGAGKTTLLRILLGVLVPDAGELEWNGHQVTARDRQRWGYMPQERSLYPAMPAGEQLVYFGRLHGCSRVTVNGPEDVPGADRVDSAATTAHPVVFARVQAQKWDER